MPVQKASDITGANCMSIWVCYHSIKTEFHSFTLWQAKYELKSLIDKKANFAISCRLSRYYTTSGLHNL